MITLENPLLISGVPVFRDGIDPTLFWVLPAAPQLSSTPVGDSSFTLLEYRTASGTGGGFAELEIELTTPGGAALASGTGVDHARLAVVPFRSGDVELLTASDPSLVQTIAGASAAPLAPPFHTVFALDVTEQGAALLAQAATMPTAPVGVVYQLRFLAQTPALHAHVTMDYAQTYDHFATSLGFTYYVSVRLDVELSWLVQHGLVKIEITQFTDDADQQRQQTAVLDLVRARIQADFFTSALPTAPDAAPLGGALGQIVGRQVGQNVTSSTALFVLKARLDVASELKTFELWYDGQTVEELTHVVSGFLGAMVGASGSPPAIRQITADNPFFATMDVRIIVAIDFDDVPDLREAAVTISYGSRVQSYVATKDAPGPFRFTAPLDATLPGYTTHTEYHFDPASNAGPATISPADSTRRDGAFITGSHDAFSVVRVHVTSAAAALSLIPQLQVDLRVVPVAGGSPLAEDVLTLDANHQQLDWYRRVPGPQSAFRIMARTDWQDSTGLVHPGDDVEVVGANYLARGPIVEELTVLVQPALDWTAITEVVVEVRHSVIGIVQDQSLTFSAAAGTSPRAVTLALADATQRGYSYRATLLRVDGTTTLIDWTAVDAAVLLVTDPASGKASVRVVWIGDVGTALALQVNFWVTPSGGTEQQVASALLQPATKDVTVSWPSPGSTQPNYRYEVHRMDASGDTLVHSGTDSTAMLVVRSDG